MDRRDIFDNYYPFAAYYIPKRSSSSHANTDYDDDESEYLMKFDNFINNVTKTSQDLSNYILSRYNSSQGSTSNSTSLVVDNNNSTLNHAAGSSNVIYEEGEYGGDESEEEEGWWKYFAFGTYPSSCMWFMLQLSWRILFTLSLAFTLWYLCTKPPPPRLSVKAAGVYHFALGEGQDASGVATKFMTCNCSMDLVIDNKSKIFGLHVSPPLLQMSSFTDHLHLAVSQGPNLFAPKKHKTPLGLHVGVANKPIYGAGPLMEQMLRSKRGLPIIVTISFKSKYKVLGNLIKPTFHHQTHCTLVVRKHKTTGINNHDYTSSSACKIMSPS